MSAVLVSGASGFVGLNLVEALLAAGREVVALSVDGMPAPAVATLEKLPGRLHDLRGDVCDPAAWDRAFAAARATLVWHGAAITGNAAREAKAARRILEVNLIGLQTALDAATRHDAGRFVYPSSVAAYGDAPFAVGGPIAEDETLEPVTLYAITKATGERIVARHAAIAGLSAASARITAVYGPWERDTGLRDTLSPPFELARRAVAGLETRLAPAGARDWTHAADVARAFVALLDAPAPRHRVYNLAGGEAWDLARLAERLAPRFPAFRWRRAEAGETLDVAYGFPLDRARRLVSPARFEAEFGAFGPGGVDAAIDSYAAWCAAHRDALT